MNFKYSMSQFFLLAKTIFGVENIDGFDARLTIRQMFPFQ